MLIVQLLRQREPRSDYLRAEDRPAAPAARHEMHRPRIPLATSEFDRVALLLGELVDAQLQEEAHPASVLVDRRDPRPSGATHVLRARSGSNHRKPVDPRL